MSQFKSWLLGVVAAALVVALADALTPQGTIKRLGRLTGGLVLILAMARPLVRVDLESLWTGLWTLQEAPSADRYGDEALKALIAQRAGAYIVDKGQALGMTCTAAVTVAQDPSGWPVPWSAEMVGRWTQEQKQELEAAIAEELNIPAGRQSYREEGS